MTLDNDHHSSTQTLILMQTHDVFLYPKDNLQSLTKNFFTQYTYKRCIFKPQHKLCRQQESVLLSLLLSKNFSLLFYYFCSYFLTALALHFDIKYFCTSAFCKIISFMQK